MEERKGKEQKSSKSPVILFISCFYHNSVAALLKGIEIIAASQEERLTRNKFDKFFPIESISFCLDQAKVNL